MLKTFKIGGVHPPENKLSAAGKIQVLPIPEKVIIPLGQHIGAPATPIVQKGDKVKTGQLIAQANTNKTAISVAKYSYNEGNGRATINIGGKEYTAEALSAGGSYAGSKNG